MNPSSEKKLPKSNTSYRYTLVQNLRLPLCWLTGHRYDAPFFMVNALYFCTRCGREMLGRSWDDLRPMTAEERDAFDMACQAYEEADYVAR